MHEDPEQHVRYVTLGDQWVGIEDEQSMAEKVSLFLVGCLMSQQHACASQGRIYPDMFTCSHAEIEIADQTF